jgi:hypothetical protein
MMLRYFRTNLQPNSEEITQLADTLTPKKIEDYNMLKGKTPKE